LPGIKRRSKVTLLGTSVAVKNTLANGGLTITPPAISPANNPGTYAWVYKVEGVD
jgi:alpha-L-fucosidase